MIKKRILLVDDEPSVINALTRLLKPLKLDIFSASNGVEALQKLQENPVDIVISDLSMPEMNGADLLSQVAQDYPETIRIMLTAYADLEKVLNAVNEGKVWGYMQKPWNNDELLITIEQALQFQEVIAEKSLLKRTLDRYQKIKRPIFEGFIGDSMAMQFVYSAIEKSSPSNASVFITGKSGTGKEVAAEAIHNRSKRSNAPFIALNCAAIPQELMESEIFGHIKGAFSGAIANRDGAATLANQGTLFLDELGEMDISLQAKLLRFIQTGEYQKVGSGKTEKSDIRFICATNREPLQAIKEGKLREDLYYRLNVIAIDLPPLNEREDDVLQIAKYFLKQYAQQEEKEFAGFSNDAETLLRQYTWPGNVRQLQNAIHSTIVMSDGPLISSDDIARQLKLDKKSALQLSVEGTNFTPPSTEDSQPYSNSVNAVESNDLDTSYDETLSLKLDPNRPIEPLAEIERRAIERAIASCKDNIVQAASALGVSPSTLYRKIQQWQD